VPLDELDKRFAQAAVRAGLLRGDQLAASTARAEAEGKTLSRLAIAAAADADELLGILRTLHAGFPAQEEDALDRHEDRLMAKLGLRARTLDEATARDAVAEQDRRRAPGAELVRLGEILVASGKLPAMQAERLYRQLENAVAICADCFAPNPRGGRAPGASIECPRCGRAYPVPPPAEKPAWAKRLAAAGEMTSDHVYEAAKQVALDAASPHPMLPAAGAPTAPKPAAPAAQEPGEPETAAGGRRLVPQKRRKPRLGPGAGQGAARISKRQKLAAIGVLGATVVIVGLVIVFLAGVSKKEAARGRFARFDRHVSDARARKAEGDLAAAAQEYRAAFEQEGEPVPLEPDQTASLAAARAERALCEDFVRRDRETAQDGDATRLGELARGCKDKDVVRAVIARLATSRDPEAAGQLVALASHDDQDVRAAALDAGIKLGGKASVPLLVAAIDGNDEARAKVAAQAALEVKDPAALPAIEKALARFPNETELARAAAEEMGRWRSPLASSLLSRLARSDKSQVAEAAIGGIAALGGAEAIPELIRGLDGNEALQTSCATALEKLGERAVDPLGDSLARGQATAALPLIAIATPHAIAAIAKGLPGLAWPGRAQVLDTVLQRGTIAPGALRSVVEKLIDEAREAVARRDAALGRNELARVVDAARAFGFPGAADDLRFELAFQSFAARAPLPLGKALEVVDDPKGGEPTIELANFTEVRLVLYAKGPERVELKAPPGAEVVRSVAPGKYAIGIARVDEKGDEVDPTIGDVELARGRRAVLQYGDRPEPVVAGEPAPRAPAEPTSKPADEPTLKKIFDRAFRAEQLVGAARKKVAERFAKETPWPRDKESREETAHYGVASDAGPAATKKVGAALEAAHAAYAKLVAPAEGKFAVRFFAAKQSYDDWRRRTSLAATFTDDLVAERKLPDRARAIATKLGQDQMGALLGEIARALETKDGVDELEIADIESLDDELGRLESTSDAKELKRGVAKILLGARGLELIAAAQGKSAHSIVLGHYNPETKELCLYQTEGWEDTLRHEAFHQFLFAHAPRAPRWLHEGMATWFEALAKGGRNELRIDELREVDEQTSFLESLKLADVVRAERLESIDYAISWSFIHYLIENEPAALGRILARARDGMATTAGVLSALDDPEKTEARWREATKKLISKKEK
jgi:HEAT repeat protein